MVKSQYIKVIYYLYSSIQKKFKVLVIKLFLKTSKGSISKLFYSTLCEQLSDISAFQYFLPFILNFRQSDIVELSSFRNWVEHAKLLKIKFCFLISLSLNKMRKYHLNYCIHFYCKPNIICHILCPLGLISWGTWIMAGKTYKINLWNFLLIPHSN